MGPLMQRTGALLVLVAALCPITYALYEDQSGTFDWYRQQLGQVTTAQLHAGSNRLAVATAGNLMGLVHYHNGTISWRRTHTAQDPLDTIVTFQKPAVVVAVSRRGAYLRGWEPSKGLLKWQSMATWASEAAEGSALAAPAAAAVADPKSGVPLLAVATAHGVQLLDPASGSARWKSALKPAPPAGSQLLLSSSEGGIHVAAFTPGAAQLLAWTLDWQEGAASQQQELDAGGAVTAATGAGASVVALTQAGTHLCASSGEGSELACIEISSLVPGASAAKRLAAAGDNTVAVTTVKHGVALVSVTLDGSLQLLSHFASATAVSPPLTLPAGSTFVAVGSFSSSGGNSDGSVEVSVVDVATGKQAQKLAATGIKQEMHPGSAKPALGQLFLLARAAGGKAEPGHEELAAVGVLTDHQLLMVGKKGLLWKREEALGGVHRSLMVDLPARRFAAAAQDGAAADGASKPPPSLAARLLQQVFGVDLEQLQRWARLQTLTALVQFKLNSQEEQDELLQLRQELSDKNMPYRDTKGFRKQVVVLTAPGKLLALHNGDGRVLWSTYLPQLASAEAHQVLLLPWRMHHDLTHAPELLVVKKGAAGEAAALVVQAHSGAVLQELQVPAEGVDQVSALGVITTEDKAEQQLYLLVSPATSPAAPPPVTLLPQTPAALKYLTKTSSKAAVGSGGRFFWSLQAVEGPSERASLAGYVLSVQQLQVTAREAWRVSLPGRVLASVAKDPSAPMYSAVKILGDRGFKYKYTNPNVLLLAVASGNPTDPINQQQLTMMLIDTVTGGVLVQQRHEAAAGPVHGLVSEHWAAYSFTDLRTMRPQVTMLELYVVRPYDLNLESLIKGQLQPPATTSSYAVVQLEVLQQSFYFQQRIKAVGVTLTRQGITTQQLLLGTISDQVFALDQRFLDPRRPMRAKATPQEMEERLLPFSELIPFFPNGYITQDKQVAQLQSIQSMPSVLESTSLVLVTGVDLFYTRVTPARHFDSLEPDFSYGLLVVGLLALAVGAVVMHYYSRQSVVKQKWL